jgi:hypothetical protein
VTGGKDLHHLRWQQMTERQKSASEFLFEAVQILDKDTIGERVTGTDLDRVRYCIERALTELQLARVNAQSGIDQI